MFPTQIEEVLLATDWCGGHFIIELTREGRMDEMIVLAEARPESWDGSGLTVHAERVSTYIKNTIGITTGVRIVAPETLERSLARPDASTTSGRRSDCEPHGEEARQRRLEPWATGAAAHPSRRDEDVAPQDEGERVGKGSEDDGRRLSLHSSLLRRKLLHWNDAHCAVDQTDSA